MNLSKKKFTPKKYFHEKIYPPKIFFTKNFSHGNLISDKFRYIDAYWKESIALSEKGPSEQKEFLQRAADVHIVTAGLKAFTGWWAVDAMEMCRRSLGGHGYSAYNAIAGLIGDWGVITTGGGDNIVLAQQCARYLLGSLKKVLAGKKVGGNIFSWGEFFLCLTFVDQNLTFVDFFFLLNLFFPAIF